MQLDDQHAMEVRSDRVVLCYVAVAGRLVGADGAADLAKSFGHQSLVPLDDFVIGSALSVRWKRQDRWQEHGGNGIDRPSCVHDVHARHRNYSVCHSSKRLKD